MPPCPTRPANTPPTTPRCTASPACSPTWPPSAPTRSSPPTTRQHSPSSPPPPHYSTVPSNYSASPTASATGSHVDNTKPQVAAHPSPHQGELRTRSESIPGIVATSDPSRSATVSDPSL